MGIGRLSKKQKKTQVAHNRALEHFALKRSSGHHGRLVNAVSATDDSAVEIQSFSDPSVRYQISIERSEGQLPVLTECSCLDFKTRRQLCKHIVETSLKVARCVFMVF